MAGGGEFDEGVMEAPPETGGVASTGLPVPLDDRDIVTSVGLTMSTSDVREDGSVPGGGQIVIKVPPADLDRLDTDLQGEPVGRSMPAAYPGTAPPPVATQRIPDVDGTAQLDGDTMVEGEPQPETDDV